MRPLSFTKNLGGFQKAYNAIREGYTVGVTVQQFRKRCGLSSGLSLLVTEFLLAAQIDGKDEFIIGDSLIAPAESIRDEHRNPAVIDVATSAVNQAIAIVNCSDSGLVEARRG